MSTVPDKYPQTIDWLTDRIDAWTAQGGSIGLDEPTTTALSTQLAIAQGSMDSAFQARLDSKDATVVYHDQARSLLELTRQAVSTIRAFAKASDTPGTVYSAASIPPPADPAPSPAPGTPTQFRTELLFSGELRVRFDCENPSGVSGVTYKVERQDGPQTPFNFVTTAKGREFTDAGIPAGTAEVTYRVTAQTSTKDGDAGGATIRFGAGNQSIVFGEDTIGTKLAG
ncbi:MAG: hypothetical protein NCW75_07825 [Phycisphaera sp.]|nr:MAG: hypothetical protein NCW75_07825 [Phycisphaera sp.]